MPDDIHAWLDRLGLGKYAEVFASNEIDFRALPRLSEEDLIALGLPMGARRNLQAAVRELSGQEAGTPPHPRGGPSPGPDEAGRRQMTVLFCDLAGSTELAQRLDPEELREVMRAYQGVCATAIESSGGCIARYMGDGVLAYFGYPQAHEDDPERAVHAGLALVKAAGGLDERFADALDRRIQVRVGIATGTVVVGDIIGEGAAMESAVVGQTPNLAARLQSAARPDTVLVSPTTRRLALGGFEFESEGARQLKGFKDPVTAWRAVREKSRSSLFEDHPAPAASPLVGREPELALLAERWQRSVRGEGQVVLLSGEAGIGKTRILRELQRLLQTQNRSRVLYFGSPNHLNSSFYPASDQLARGFRFARGDSAAQKLDKIERGLEILDLPVAEIAPLLATLHALPAGDRYPRLDFSPEQLRSELIEAILAVTEAMAKRNPVLQIVEDAHWIDPSTLDFIGRCIERFRDSRIMQVITFRPDFTPPWPAGGNVAALSLSNLSRSESEILVDRTAGGAGLGAAVREQILASTDGVPLFIEELTRSVIESDGSGCAVDPPGTPATAAPAVAIPETLQDSLRSRLDRLGDALEAAQTAAVIGRRFTYELLASASGLSRASLDGMLAELIRAGLVFRRGSGGDTTYEFKHALVQEAAYQGLLRPRRSAIHARVAGAMLEDRSGEIAAHPEWVARHCSLGGLRDPAVRHWRLAGERAMERSAHVEAVACFNEALAALDGPGDGNESAAAQTEQGIDLRLRLRGALNSLGRFREMSDHLKVAARLAEAIDDTRRIAEVKVGESWALGLLGDLQGAVEAGLRARRSARCAGDRPLEAAAGLALGWVYWFLGEARKSIEAHAEHVDYLTQPDLRFERFGHAGVRSIFCLSNLSRCHAALGEFEEAIALGRRSCELAEELGRAYDLVYAHAWLGTVLQCRGELADAATHLERALNVPASETLFIYPTLARELALTYMITGRLEEARKLLEAAMDASLDMEFPIQRAWIGAYLGRLCLLEGSPRDALTCARRSLQLAREGGYQWVEVFALRVLGMIGAKSDCLAVNDAHTCLTQSVDRSIQLHLTPETAHGRLALGDLLAGSGRPADAPAAWAAARALYRSMGMRYWEGRADLRLKSRSP